MGSLKHVQHDSTLLLQLFGEVTLSEVPELRAEITKHVDTTVYDHLVLDMSEVPFIDSSGVGMLVSLNTSLKAQEKMLFLLSPTEQTLKTLELVQLMDFFHILNNEEELLTNIPEE